MKSRLSCSSVEMRTVALCYYTSREKNMATLTIRSSDKLKTVRLTFQYIFENKQLPVENIIIGEYETDLIATVQERLKNPQKVIKVNLDDL